MSEHPEHWLSELYRASAREEPPDALDAAILAASRKESRGWSSLTRHWQAPLAAAAVIVITVTLVIAVRNDPAHLEQSPDHLIKSEEVASSYAFEARADRERRDEQRVVAARKLHTEAEPAQPTGPPARSDRDKGAAALSQAPASSSPMPARKSEAAERDAAAAVAPQA